MASPVHSSTSTVKRLLLCRHGETAPNALGVLQGSGIDEFLNKLIAALTIALSLPLLRLHRLITSPIQRALQTAQIVGEKHPDTPLIQVPELAEISWGDWEGHKVPQLAELLRKWAIDGDYNAKTPNGESPLEVEARAVPALYKIIAERPEQTIVLIVHGRLLRVILSSIFFHSLKHMNDFTHHNTCINLIDVNIETDPAKVGAAPYIDHAHLMHLMALNRSRSLDDNMTVAETPIVSPGHSMTLPIHPDIESQSVQHPPHLTWLPLLLDDRGHLTHKPTAKKQ
eukprot:jgi/Hompol1/3195/HPOL_006400-RA